MEGHVELRNRAAAGEGARQPGPTPLAAAGDCCSSMRRLLGILLVADGLGPDQSLHTEAAPVHGADGVLPGGHQGERPLRVSAGERAGHRSSQSTATPQTSRGSRKVPPSGLELSRISCAQRFQKT